MDDDAVLVFSRTTGYRHDSIPDGIGAVRDLGSQRGFTVDATEDAGAFTPGTLRRYGAVVWLSTSGQVLDGAGRAAFERYVRDGGGYVGIHAAADTEYDWPWYGGLVGAYFRSHPEIQDATIRVEDRTHPSTAHLGAGWNRRAHLLGGIRYAAGRIRVGRGAESGWPAAAAGGSTTLNPDTPGDTPTQG